MQVAAIATAARPIANVWRRKASDLPNPTPSCVAESKFKNRDKFGEAKQGYILLQDHGGGIAFRNIRIKVLDD